jgi:ATP-dependent Clp protease ATP-binding subunit ClpA
VISQVVEKFVFQLEAQLGDRNITIELTPDANTWLAERGYDDKFGARPLARVIQEQIKKPLAEEILFGALKDGGIVRVLVEEKGAEKVLGFEYLKPDAPVKPRDPEESEDEVPGDGTPKGPPKSGGPKPRAKRGARKSKPARDRSVGASLVPKVPLGSK